MGLLSKCPVPSEDRLLVSENAASNLLSLAAQIALEVGLIKEHTTLFCNSVVKFADYLRRECLLWWNYCPVSHLMKL